MIALPSSFAAIEVVLEQGDMSHPADDWRSHPAAYHIGRARRHLGLLAMGYASEPHLTHATTRLLMALTIREMG